MAESGKELHWEPWSRDPRVQFACSDEGIKVRVPDGKGWLKTSGWCRMIGHNVDVTIRQLLYEIEHTQ